MAAHAPPRQPTILVKLPRVGGVLPICPANTKGRPSGATTMTVKPPASRLKVVVRRLAPGLTEGEFFSIVGDEWKSGTERTDWASYVPGKISKDPAKSSRPSRAYLHLTKEEHLKALSDRVRDVIFLDAKGSNNDPALLSPPTVEFAPFARIPSSKVRKDGRQGTIDQDPEFIDFLESLTNIVPKPSAIDSTSDKERQEEEKPLVTPLVQYLKDKKANKGKESVAPSKAQKHSRQDSRDAKSSHGTDKTGSAKNSRDGAASEKRITLATRPDKAAREGGKGSKRHTQSNGGKPAVASTAEAEKPSGTSPEQASTTEEPSILQSSTSATQGPASKPERKRERGNVSAAARMLQRDLGLGGSSKRRRDTATTTETSGVASTTSSAPLNENCTPVSVAKSSSARSPSTATEASGPPQSAPAPKAIRPTEQAKEVSSKPKNASAGGRGPGKTKSSQRSQQQSGGQRQPVQTPGNNTNTQAFLKHANPSQGITEPLLEQAFSVFGKVTKVEIDKKKGFAYVDFAEPTGLQSAIAASPVAVSEAKVIVLERRANPGNPQPSKGQKSGGGANAAERSGGGGGGRGPGSSGFKGGRGGSGRGKGERRNTDSAEKGAAAVAPKASSSGAQKEAPLSTAKASSAGPTAAPLSDSGPAS